jgi:hypothetical protein
LREERRLRVFENRVLRRVLGPKRDEVIGEWRKLHNEELNDLYSLSNIVRGCTGCWWGRQRERGHWGDIDGRIILRWIFRKLEWGLDRFGSRQGQVAGTCEYGKELSGSIKMRGIF